MVLVERGKAENTEKNPQSKAEPTTNSTHIWHQAGIEPRPHWWEESTLTTVPTLLNVLFHIVIITIHELLFYLLSETEEVKPPKLLFKPSILSDVAKNLTSSSSKCTYNDNNYLFVFLVILCLGFIINSYYN